MVTDQYGTPITNSTTVVVYIKRTSDNKYFTGSTWSTTETSISMPKNYQCLYTYNFSIPATPDTYTIFAYDSVNKVSGALVLEAVDKLEYLDRKVSDTLLGNNYIAPDNVGIASLNSKIDTKLDMKVSDVPTVDEVWNYSSRTLSPQNTSGVGSCNVTVTIPSGVEIEVYDSNRVAITEAISNGTITFNLNPSSYYFISKGLGYWTKETQVIVPSSPTYNLTIAMQEMDNGETLGIKFRELPCKDLVVGDTNIRIGIEGYTLNGKTFSIDSVAAKIGSTNLTTEIANNKVYAIVTPSTSGTIIIEYTIVVNSETFKYKISKKVV